MDAIFQAKETIEVVDGSNVKPAEDGDTDFHTNTETDGSKKNKEVSPVLPENEFKGS